MAWWGFTDAHNCVLGKPFTIGPGNQPAPGSKWLIQMWINDKYVELGRDWEATRNVSITLTANDDKGRAVMRAIGNNTVGHATYNAIRYTGGNWSSGGQQHQQQVIKGTATFTIPDEDQFKPGIALEVQPVNGFNGRYIKGKSRVQTNLTPTPNHGADIRDTRTYVGSSDEVYLGPETNFSKILTKAGTMRITGYVTDGRGFTNSVTKEITVEDYSDPRISTFTVDRCTVDGTISNEGEYVKITYNYTCDTLTGNTCAAVFKYSTDNGVTWTDIKTLTALSESGTFVASQTVATNARAMFKLSVTDKFTTAESTGNITPSLSLMGYCLHPKPGLSIGRAANIENDQGMFSVAMPARFENYYSSESSECSYKHYAQKIKGIADGTLLWHHLGDIKDSDAMNTNIVIYTGNGYNGETRQNTEIYIRIKNGAQNPASTTKAYGCTYRIEGHYPDGIKVQVRATNHDSCQVWVYLPFDYPHGVVTIDTEGIWTPSTEKTTTEPTTGVAQAVKNKTHHLKLVNFSKSFSTPSTAKPYKPNSVLSIPYSRPEGYQFLMCGQIQFDGFNGSAFIDWTFDSNGTSLPIWYETATGMTSGMTNTITVPILFTTYEED